MLSISSKTGNPTSLAFLQTIVLEFATSIVFAIYLSSFLEPVVVLVVDDVAVAEDGDRTRPEIIFLDHSTHVRSRVLYSEFEYERRIPQALK